MKPVFVAIRTTARAWLYVAIDYRRDDFAKVLSNYNVALNNQDAAPLVRSISILKTGGSVVSISGPSDPAFAKSIGANWFVRQVMRLLSAKT